jgi:hypothetical protein
MLRLVHKAFPRAALWDYRHALLGHGDAKPPINGRTFKRTRDDGERDSAAFAIGLQAFLSATVEPEPVQEVGYSGEKLVFRPGQAAGKVSEFVSSTARMIEVDCLLMLPPPAVAHWNLQAMEGSGRDRPFFIWHDSAKGSVAAPLPLPPQHPPAVRSNFSQDHFPPNSSMYVVGEVYHPVTKSEGIPQSVQKLVQIERILQFLCAREGGVPVECCVLGVVFMGPHMSAQVGEAMSKALEVYSSRLPCLWRLQQLQRFIALRLAGYFPAVVALHQEEAMEVLKAGQVDLSKRMVDLSARMDTLTAGLEGLKQTLALVLERLPPPPGPLQQVQAPA